jgi:hypothetical protein
MCHSSIKDVAYIKRVSPLDIIYNISNNTIPS